MVVSAEYDLEILLDYGFEKIDKEEELECENYTLSNFNYKFNVGHSRRGQYYYLLVKESDRIVYVFATEPDGSGGIVYCPNVLKKLIIEGIVS